MLVSPARRRNGLDIVVLRLPPLSTLFALEDINQSSASASSRKPNPPSRSTARFGEARALSVRDFSNKNVFRIYTSTNIRLYYNLRRRFHAVVCACTGRAPHRCNTRARACWAHRPMDYPWTVSYITSARQSLLPLHPIPHHQQQAFHGRPSSLLVPDPPASAHQQRVSPSCAPHHIVP